MASSRIFSDLDLSFTKHPITKDVSLKTKENSIIQSIKTLLMTSRGERAFNPRLGGNINRLLFEPIDATTASILQNEIKTTIINFEPRIAIDALDVYADIDNDGYRISLKFYVENSIKPLNILLFLNRLR